MPSNYSDNPSMDEILSRIKKALAERENKVANLENNYESSDDTSFQQNFHKESNDVLTFEKMKEFSSSKNFTEKIVNNLIDDNLFIKPVVQKKTDDEVVQHLSQSQKVENREDIFILTKNMKVNKKISFDNIDFDVFCKEVAFALGRDLAISYLSPKIETWLKANLGDIIKKAHK